MKKALEEADEEKEVVKKRKKDQIEVKLSVKDLEYTWEEEMKKVELADRQSGTVIQYVP